MSELEPEAIPAAQVSQRWAGLVRTGLDLAAVGTWDPFLVRDTRVLVPIDVQALYVPHGTTESFVRFPFAVTRPDGEPPEPMPEPFDPGAPRSPGVHLHWAMPDALLRGRLTEQAGSNRLGLPALPDRWLVLRLLAPAKEQLP